MNYSCACVAQSSSANCSITFRSEGYIGATQELSLKSRTESKPSYCSRIFYTLLGNALFTFRQQTPHVRVMTLLLCRWEAKLQASRAWCSCSWPSYPVGISFTNMNFYEYCLFPSEKTLSHVMFTFPPGLYCICIFVFGKRFRKHYQLYPEFPVVNKQLQMFKMMHRRFVCWGLWKQSSEQRSLHVCTYTRTHTAYTASVHTDFAS